MAGYARKEAQVHADMRLVLKKNTCENPSIKGFLGLLNHVLAFVVVSQIN